MRSHMKSKVKTGWILVAALVGGLVSNTGTWLFADRTQAQTQVQISQQEALYAVQTMMEGQRTYFRKNGKWLAVVNDLKQDLGATLPASFDYAVRTTTEAAYNYVIPASSANTSNLKAYVGAAFLAPDGSGQITTIICENTASGQIRPADPRIVRGQNPSQPPFALACGDASVEVPASKVTE